MRGAGERRARQIATIDNWKPWEKSTGPKIEEGEVARVGNSRKHGMCSQKPQEKMRGLRILERLPIGSRPKQLNRMQISPPEWWVFFVRLAGIAGKWLHGGYMKPESKKPGWLGLSAYSGGA